MESTLKAHTGFVVVRPCDLFLPLNISPVFRGSRKPAVRRAFVLAGDAKMAMIRTRQLVLLILLCGPACRHTERGFPAWRGSNTQLYGDWIASPIVAVGDVVNIEPYGEQAVSQLPWPMSPEVRDLFWCQGDFRVTAVVKGQLPARPKKYLWASSQPGCKLWYGSERAFQRLTTRAWFLREEGDFLRPPFDGGSHLFVGLWANWNDGPSLPARQHLGTLLLTPAFNGDTLGDYADYLWHVGDIACELLGKEECIPRIRDLAHMGNPALHEAACGFLHGQLGADCNSK